MYAIIFFLIKLLTAVVVIVTDRTLSNIQSFIKLYINEHNLTQEGTPSKLRYAGNPHLQQLQQQIKQQQEYIGGRNTAIESPARRDGSVIQVMHLLFTQHLQRDRR